MFDEANKLRHFTIELMRRLDTAGIDTFLPDLPGCNESLAPLEAQTGWQRSVSMPWETLADAVRFAIDEVAASIQPILRQHHLDVRPGHPTLAALDSRRLDGCNGQPSPLFRRPRWRWSGPP